MKILGLDIGTTTVSAVVVEAQQVLSSATLKNDSFLQTENPWERLQDPEQIRATVMQATEQMLNLHPDVAAIGVTGQMHGILYLNDRGEPVSPLYTWQDGRGELPYDDNSTYVGYMRCLTGYPLATGFGMVTHFYNLRNGLVPEGAVVFCTIHDYIAMQLVEKTTPVLDASDAASFGLFQVEQGVYDMAALKKVGVDSTLLPPLAKDPYIGQFRGTIPVFAAIGDNQASFIGATGGDTDCMLVNMGTGGQFSVFSQDYLSCPGLETRPFPGGGFLLVGASLCGGRAYALLEQFLRDAAAQITGKPVESCYAVMDRILQGTAKPVNLPITTPLFQGTRDNPGVRGSIVNLDVENFTVAHFIWSMLEGMTEELHQMYTAYVSHGGKSVRLVGSGNGLRKNIHLQNCFAAKFGQPLFMSGCQEEAAAGAALFAAVKVCE